MNQQPKLSPSKLNTNTNPAIILIEAVRHTTHEEALEIITANLKKDGTLCDDFKDDLLWLISVKDQPIEMRKLGWKKRVDEYRKANGFGDDLITLEQAEKLRDYNLDPVEIRGVPMSVYTVALDYDNRTVKVTMSATWL